MPRTLLRTLIGLAIGGFFVWLSAKDWPMDQLAGTTALDGGVLRVGEVGAGWTLELWWLVPYLGVLTLIHFLRVVRWQPLLDPIAELSFQDHNRIGAVGFMAMFLMPLRLGELVRPYLVKVATGGEARMSQVLATVVVERIVDGLMVSLLLVGTLVALPSGDSAAGLQLGALAALAVFVGASVLLIGAVWKHDLTVTIVDRTVGLVSKGLAHKVTELLDAFLYGLRAQPSLRAFGWFLLLSFVYWAVNGIGVWLMAKAFALPTDMAGAYAMMACVVVGMMIPNSPGNVGSFWYFLVLPLPLYGMEIAASQAVAFGVTVWLLQLVQQTAFGAWYVLKGDVAWQRVMEATREDESSLTAHERDGGRTPAPSRP